jgi:hypothetical protein
MFGSKDEKKKGATIAGPAGEGNTVPQPYVTEPIIMIRTWPKRTRTTREPEDRFV